MQASTWLSFYWFSGSRGFKCECWARHTVSGLLARPEDVVHPLPELHVLLLKLPVPTNMLGLPKGQIRDLILKFLLVE
eukprot:scaffold647899_cov47-Prasinocladus_malaysianus.AAC.2